MVNLILGIGIGMMVVIFKDDILALVAKLREKVKL